MASRTQTLGVALLCVLPKAHNIFSSQSAVTGVGLDCNEKEPTEHLPGNCEQHTGTEKGQKRLCEETEVGLLI